MESGHNISGQHVRAMALDVGDRRIGIAVTDALGIAVFGRPTLGRTNLDADIAHIRRMVEENGVTELVVGLPTRMDGTRSRQTEKTEEFVSRLGPAVSVPVILWDERLTSVEAERQLQEMGLDWQARKRHVDELAATLILEDYLNRR